MQTTHLVRRIAAALALAVSTIAAGTAAPVGASTAVGASPAQGQCGTTSATPRLTVSRTTLGVDETAVVTVTGTNYLVPPHVCGRDVFGGVYLFFGWVRPGGQWGPSWRSSDSDRGLFGTTYSYPGEGGGAETRDDGTGRIRMIAFTRGGESGTSTDFHMDAAGNWRSELTIQGATYTYTDLRTGATNSVDCRIVQCGVYTVGAHAKSSRTNEVFTPINFADTSGRPIVPSNPAGGGDGGTTGTVPASAGAGGGSSGSGAASAGAGGAAPTTIALAVGPVGSVGEAPPTTEDAEVAGAVESRPARSAERAAAVQEFDSGDGGSSSTGTVIGAVVAALVVLGGGGAALARRGRTRQTEGTA